MLRLNKNGVAKGLAVILFAGALLFAFQAEAACAKKWETWHDAFRGEHGVLKVDYQVCSRTEFNFKVFRNTDWDGHGTNFEKIDEFTISPRNNHYEKLVKEFYKSAAGPISVQYEITADFSKNKVLSKGYITSPEPKNILMTEKRTWDQYFFDIPSEDKVTVTREGGYDFVETTDIWSAFCSNLACGPFVTFPDFRSSHADDNNEAYKHIDIPNDYPEAHRFNVNIPGIGPAIVQLWKGWCPRMNEHNQGHYLANLINLGKEFPGGIGAEVGVYVPRNNGTMFGAATAKTTVGTGEWFPLVNHDLKISFKLVHPKTGEVLVDAPERHTWWRTKWITAESLGEYKKNHEVPKNLLEYELHYTINGVPQEPWRNALYPGRYPEIGFNGIWQFSRITEKNNGMIDPADLRLHVNKDKDEFDFKYMEIYHNGNTVQMAFFDEKNPLYEYKDGTVSLIAVPLNGNVSGNSSSKGKFVISAKQSGGSTGKLTLSLKYDRSEFDRTYELSFNSIDGGIIIKNTSRGGDAFTKGVLKTALFDPL